MTSLVRGGVTALLVALAIQGTASAQGQVQLQDLAGLWKRPASDSLSAARHFRFEGDGERLRGVMLDPPAGMSCDVTLGRAPTGELVGEARWTEGEWEATSRWEFRVVDANTLAGRSEWLDWEGGVVYERGWEPQKLERVRPVGLVVGPPARDVPSSTPLPELTRLEGGWAGPDGPWKLDVDQGAVVLTPLGDHHPGSRIRLSTREGLLVGEAQLPEGGASQVELALAGDALAGRSSWTAGAELGEQAEEGWSSLRFERLQRVDAGPAAETVAPEPAAELGDLVGAWRRDDGLYLRVRRDGAGLDGVLSGADGAPVARLRFEAQDGIWVGIANWEGVETRWELVPGDDGALEGRTQWADLHEGVVVDRGWSPRAFRKLRRIH